MNSNHCSGKLKLPWRNGNWSKTEKQIILTLEVIPCMSLCIKRQPWLHWEIWFPHLLLNHSWISCSQRLRLEMFVPWIYWGLTLRRNLWGSQGSWTGRGQSQARMWHLITLLPGTLWSKIPPGGKRTEACILLRQSVLLCHLPGM